MSWATPVRSHVVVTMMARSISVERSVPALLELARVSGLGMGMGFYLVSGLYGGPPRILLVDTSRTNTTSSAALYENPRTGRTPSHRRLATDVTRAPRGESGEREFLCESVARGAAEAGLGPKSAKF